MNRIILSLILLGSTLNFISCKKSDISNEKGKYTTIEITVKKESGEKTEGLYVKMYDPKTYELFKENHQTKALAEAATNKEGKATFTLDNSKWFDEKKSIELIFAVLEETDKNNYSFSSKGGTINKNKKARLTIILQNETTIPNSIFVIENNILKDITDKTVSSVILPPDIKGIANNAFEGSNISEITLNEGIETIGDACFLNSKIKKINFPSSLKTIGKAAFQDCSMLEKADMSQTAIEVLPEGIFFDSGLKEISLPSRLKEISNEAFCGTINLQNIEISASTTIIGNKAFYQSGLTEITLHNNYLIIDHMAFANCINLKKVSKTSDSGDNEGTISTGVFNDCTSLFEATLPDNITTLEGYTFIGCGKLETISLPSSLKMIGDLGLRTNYDVRTIIFNSAEVPEMSNTQKGIPNILPFTDNINEILVPEQSVEEYKNRLGSYANKIKGI